MAESQSVDPFNLDLSKPESEKPPLYRRLSLINGLLIGLAIGLGSWGQDVLRIARLPVSFYLSSLLLGVGVVIVLCGLVGWLTGRVARTPITVLLWAATGVLSMLIFSYSPYYLRTLTVWLIDSRFQGRVVFPYALEATTTGLVLGSFLIVLALAGLGLLQNYRLENIASESDQRGRLKARGWVSLLLPLPLVFLATIATQSGRPNPTAAAAELVHRAIPRAQAYEGDLRELNDGDGISYASLRPVQELIDGDYTLSIVDVDPLNATVVIGAEFTGGGWVYCRIINGQLTFCYDATPAYTTGLRSLITGEPLPEGCRGCALQQAEGVTAWLAEHRNRLGSPAIERVAQQGSHTLMRLTGNDGFTAECWIVGVSPTELTECEEVGE